MEHILALLIIGVLFFVVAGAWVLADFLRCLGCLFTGRCERCGLYYADCPCDYN